MPRRNSSRRKGSSRKPKVKIAKGDLVQIRPIAAQYRGWRGKVYNILDPSNIGVELLETSEGESFIDDEGKGHYFGFKITELVKVHSLRGKALEDLSEV